MVIIPCREEADHEPILLLEDPASARDLAEGHPALGRDFPLGLAKEDILGQQPSLHDIIAL